MRSEALITSTRTNLTLLVGTTKGAFLICGGNDRNGWAIQGPYCDGWPINHVVGDPETGTLWAGGGGEWHGAGIWLAKMEVRIGRSPALQKERWTIGPPTIPISQR